MNRFKNISLMELNMGGSSFYFNYPSGITMYTGAGQSKFKVPEDVTKVKVHLVGGGGGGYTGGSSSSTTFTGSETWTSAGTYSWTCPDGVTQVLVRLVGGGGGSAYAYNDGSDGFLGSDGGGSGGMVTAISDVSGGTTYTIVVGAGGSAGASSGDSGGDGGTSYFNGLTATGGQGSTTNFRGGGPGVGEGGNDITGNTGADENPDTSTPAAGGASVYDGYGAGATGAKDTPDGAGNAGVGGYASLHWTGTTSSDTTFTNSGGGAAYWSGIVDVTPGDILSISVGSGGGAQGGKGEYSAFGLAYLSSGGAALSQGSGGPFPGWYGASLDSSDSQYFYSIDRHPNVGGSVSFSEIAWVKTTSSGGIMTCSHENLPDDGWDKMLWLSSTGTVIFGIDNSNGTNYALSSNSITDGNWHFVVGTFNSTTGMAVYVDGVSVGGNDACTVSQTYSAYIFSGIYQPQGWSYTASSSYFNGEISGAAFIKCCLNSSQVSDFYSIRDFGNYRAQLLNYDPVFAVVEYDSPWVLGGQGASSGGDGAPGSNGTSGFTAGSGTATPANCPFHEAFGLGSATGGNDGLVYLEWGWQLADIVPNAQFITLGTTGGINCQWSVTYNNAYEEGGSDYYYYGPGPVSVSFSLTQYTVVAWGQTASYNGWWPTWTSNINGYYSTINNSFTVNWPLLSYTDVSSARAAASNNQVIGAVGYYPGIGTYNIETESGAPGINLLGLWFYTP